MPDFNVLKLLLSLFDEQSVVRAYHLEAKDANIPEQGRIPKNNVYYIVTDQVKIEELQKSHRKRTLDSTVIPSYLILSHPTLDFTAILHPTLSYTGFFCHPTLSYHILPLPTLSYPVLPILPPSFPILHCIPTTYPTPSYTGFYCHPTSSYIHCHPTTSYLVLYWILLPSNPVLPYPTPSYLILPSLTHPIFGQKIESL